MVLGSHFKTSLKIAPKSANMTPVLKNGNETQMENCRPISVLPVIAKT